ncbi:hypothetical protein BU16DRAFT_95659 [Lophium mytilinum]|uniref:Uncharacterized protein n=1 Tax=Lophium mytilinum TaxID=390894 RepID=A0A6A6QL11_9PEZI|nr:hypothetical protein BU16DRAFT_95659 [Lophium mytilinum]
MDFLLTCVYLQEASYFEDFLLLDQEKFEDDPLFHMIFSLPHRFNQVPSGSDSDIIGQLQECEQILQTVQDVTGAILFLLKVMDLQPPSTSPTGGELSFECQHRAKYLRLRETCSQRVLNCERRIERINRTIETQNKLLNIRESTSVKRLTILAALFLPASLASSFLSMSTRFKNLGPLLYDWLGVLVIISSATIVLNFGVRAILYAKAKISRAIWSPWAGWTVGRKFERPVSKLASRIFVVMQLLVYLAVWGIILACFALGMFRDFKLGGRVLGYGIAGIAAFILFFPLIVVCLVLTTPRPERSSRTTLTRSSDRP